MFSLRWNQVVTVLQYQNVVQTPAQDRHFM